MKTLCDWFALVFPAFRAEVKPRVVMDLPDWNEADAANLANFLETRTGQRMMDRMRLTVTAMCMSPDDGDVMFRATRRSMALVLNGIESMADQDYWRARAFADADDN
jgi:hypothetical protein